VQSRPIPGVLGAYLNLPVLRRRVEVSEYPGWYFCELKKDPRRLVWPLMGR